MKNWNFQVFNRMKHIFLSGKLFSLYGFIVSYNILKVIYKVGQKFIHCFKIFWENVPFLGEGAILHQKLI